MRFSAYARLAALAGALIVAAPLSAALAADLPHIISVTGEGEAKAVPDQARLTVGVTTTAVTADAALAENARKMTAVFDTLKRLGVPERAIQTSNFSVTPQYPPYNQNNTGVQRIVGYQVSNQVDVTLDDTRKLGPALDALVSSGANQINSVSFSIKDPDALLATAREAAIADATKRAETYAHAAGVTLGSVVAIQEGGSEPPQPIVRAMAVGGLRAPTPTAAGEESVSVSVTVTFEIK
jgi:uncharacterized protein